MSTIDNPDDGANTRRAPRKTVRTLARIISHDGLQTLECTVIDMSGSGAKLKLNNVSRNAFAARIEVPETFRLIIPMDNIGIDCRRAWHTSDMLGVAFLSAFQPLRPARV